MLPLLERARYAAVRVEESSEPRVYALHIVVHGQHARGRIGDRRKERAELLQRIREHRLRGHDSRQSADQMHRRELELPHRIAVAGERAWLEGLHRLDESRNIGGGVIRVGVEQKAQVLHRHHQRFAAVPVPGGERRLGQLYAVVDNRRRRALNRAHLADAEVESVVDLLWSDVKVIHSSSSSSRGFGRSHHRVVSHCPFRSIRFVVTGPRDQLRRCSAADSPRGGLPEWCVHYTKDSWFMQSKISAVLLFHF